MMKSAPKESKAAKAARLAEEAKVEQERVRAEANRIEGTQDLLEQDTLRRSRRFGKLGQGSLLSLVNAGVAGASAGAGAPAGDLNLGALMSNPGITGSMLGGLSGSAVRAKGASGRSGLLTAQY